MITKLRGIVVAILTAVVELGGTLHIIILVHYEVFLDEVCRGD